MRSGGTQQFSALRITLATVVAIDILSFIPFIGAARAAALEGGKVLGPLLDLLSQTEVRSLFALTGAVGAIAFGRRAGRFWEGLLALAALTLLSTVHAQLFGSPWRHLYYSGLCLLGWLLGLAMSRWHDESSDESYARFGCIALLGSTYFNAGISKLVFSGVEWLSGTAIQTVVVAQDGLADDHLLRPYRAWVVTTPMAAQFFSFATVALEIAGPLMIAGRAFRFAVAAGLFTMHANILLLTGIPYWEAMVFLVAFGVPTRADRDKTERGTVPRRTPNRGFIVSAALLSVGAALAIANQSRRFAQLHDRAATEGNGSPISRNVVQLGPFAVGQSVSDAWTIETLSVAEESFRIFLSGASGPCDFEITCAESEHSSPFDLGPLHIFYSNRTEFEELEPAGRGIRETIHNATVDADACRMVESWKSAATAETDR